MTSSLDVAMGYRKIGLPVFPCTDEKRPLTVNGFKNASCEAATLRKWFNAERAGVLGIPTGTYPDGRFLLVIDCDVKDGIDGHESLSAWLNGAVLPETWTVLTANGGTHYYYWMPVGFSIANSVSKLALRVDLRGEGGYVIAAGSQTSDGRTWELEASAPRTINDAPQWLVQRLRAWTQQASSAEAKTAQKSEDVQEGQRNDYLTHEAGRLVHAGFSVEKIKLLVRSLNDDLDNPLPLDELERTVFKSAHTWKFRAMSGGEADTPEEFEALQTRRAEQMREYLVPHKELMSGEEEAIPWLIDETLAAGELNVIFGVPGSFKSFVALDWALSVASGQPWNGQPVEKGAVAYLVGEDFRGQKVRYRAACRAKGIADADIDAVISRGAQDLASREGLEFVIEALESRYEKYSMIVIDTKARFSSGNENSAEDVGKMVRAIDVLIAHFGCAVLVVHHAGKNGSEMGSMAWIGAANTRWKAQKWAGGFKSALTAIKQKNGQEDVEGSPSLIVNFDRVETGATTRKGDPVTTLVSMGVTTNEEGPEPEQVPKVLGRSQQTLMDVYHEAVRRQREKGDHIPTLVKRSMVTDMATQNWSAQNKGAPAGKVGTQRRNFIKALETMMEKGTFERSGADIMLPGSLSEEELDDDIAGF